MTKPKSVIVIDENTKIPLSLAWIVGGALLTIAMSFATMLTKQETVEAQVLVLDEKIKFSDIERNQRYEKILNSLSDLKIDMGKVKEHLHINDNE